MLALIMEDLVFLEDITEKNMMRSEKRIHGIAHEVELTR